MIRFCIYFCLLLSGFVTGAQTIASAWTKTDCAGTEHILFDDLDAGKAVIMEIIMPVDCAPCITAANLMEPVVASYNALYDNRVVWYTFGFDDSYSCTEMDAWKTDNAIPCDAVFTEGADLISYYGGMGMPTIVIAGRDTHGVYFNKFGFVPADTVAFALALDYALGLAEPEPVNNYTPSPVKLLQNPVQDILTFELNSVAPVHAEIYNTEGERVMAATITGNTIDISAFPAGIYFLQLRSDNSVSAATFVKQ